MQRQQGGIPYRYKLVGLSNALFCFKDNHIENNLNELLTYFKEIDPKTRADGNTAKRICKAETKCQRWTAIHLQNHRQNVHAKSSSHQRTYAVH